MRYTFGGSASDYVVRSVTIDTTAGLAQFASATLSWWSAKTGGVQYTNLLDLAGAALTGPVVADAFGNIPQFKGPDDIVAMWGSADGGTRVLFLAVDVSTAILTRVAANEAAIASIGAGASAIDSVARDAAAAAQADADTAQTRADDAYTLAQSANSNAVVDQTARDSAALASATAQAASVTAGDAQTAAAAAQNTANQALADVTDHGALTNLDQDHHPQYHTDLRGDARYPLKTELAAAGTAAPTADTIMRRDANGRAQVANPSVAADAATKGYVDGVGTSTPTPSTIARRDSAGRLQAVDPAVAADVATRGWVLAQNFGSGSATISPPFAPFTYGGDLVVQTNPDFWFKNTTGGNLVITGISAELDVAPTGSSATFRLYKDGTGIVGTACVVADGATTGTATFVAPGHTVAAGERVGIVVTQIGATTPGSRAVVQLLGNPNTGGGGTGGGVEVRDEGTVLGAATAMNFTGTGVTASLASGIATISIASGGGSGGGAGITVGMPGSGATYIVDNTTAGAQAAFNAALTAAGKRGGIKVLPGLYTIKSPIILQREQTLEGSGAHSTYITAGTGWSGNAMVMNIFTELDSVRHRVYGVALDCANRAPRATYFGIDGTPTVWSPDPAPDFDSLYVINATGNGMDFGGAYSGNMRETRIHNCRFQHNGGWAINLTASDSQISHCTSQGSNGGGYNLAGGNNRISASKVYSAGTVAAPAPGFRIGTRATVSGCEAQDNLGNGFHIIGPDSQISGCTADSNGDGVNSNISCGFWVDGTNNKIDGTSFQRNGGGAIWKAAGAGQRHGIGYASNGTLQGLLVNVMCGTAAAPWVANQFNTAGPGSSVTVV